MDNNTAQKDIVYCFGYEKMYYIAGDYRHLAAFMTVKNGEAEQIVFAFLPRENRNLAGWQSLLEKAKEKIGHADYLLFREASFNFVMETSSILPNVKYCNNIGQIDYREAYRNESLAVERAVSEKLNAFRPADGIEGTLLALTALLKTMGTANVSVLI